jgi:hypothetical protein
MGIRGCRRKRRSAKKVREVREEHEVGVLLEGGGTKEFDGEAEGSAERAKDPGHLNRGEGKEKKPGE